MKRNEVVHNSHCRVLLQQAGPDLSFLTNWTLQLPSRGRSHEP